MATPELPLEDKNKNATKRCGQLLAEERKERKWSVERVARELNLSVTQIETLELDQAEGLPEPTYVRGYIRAYANLLGMDAEEVLSRYQNPEWQRPKTLDDMPKGVEVPVRSSIMTRALRGRLFLLTVLMVIAILVWKFYFTGGGEMPVSSQSSPQELAPTGLATNVDADQPEVTEALTQEPLQAVEERPSNQLVLRFSQTSWLDVRDQGNNKLAFRSYASGEQVTLSSDGSMRVFIGNAEGVEAEFNGTEYDLAAATEGVFARFTVGTEE